MIQWLLLKLNKATTKVPPIPPPSVIETLILSKEFWLKALFFLFEPFSILISKKATRLRNKNKKSLRVVTVFWLGKSNGLPPTSVLLLTKKKTENWKFLHKAILFLFLCNFFYISLYTKFFHLLEPQLPLLLKPTFFQKMRTKKKIMMIFRRWVDLPKKAMQKNSLLIFIYDV